MRATACGMADMRRGTSYAMARPRIILWSPGNAGDACNLLQASEGDMPIVRYLVVLSMLMLLAAPSQAQDGGIKIEKFTHSPWTRGIFSEAVTVTGIGNAKFIYLAGVGAEDEHGARGTIRHHGNFLEQCKYSYDKIKRVLAHHGATLRDVVKITTYITDLRYRLTLGE